MQDQSPGAWSGLPAAVGGEQAYQVMTRGWHCHLGKAALVGGA